MSIAYFEMLRDETLRVEIGAAAAADLAVENVELSAGDLSRAVRASAIVRGAEGLGVSANQLMMEEVRLPAAVLPGLDSCAA